MSEPKRYEPSTQCVEPSYQAQMIEPIVREVAWGNYVRFEDYARLKAEVERLTKAGDAMASKLELDEKEYLERYGIDTFAMDTRPKVVRAWNAAKENRQP